MTGLKDVMGPALYMPALHPALDGILEDGPSCGIAVICLEDALADRDRPKAMERLRRIAGDRDALPDGIWIRPADLDMARGIAAMPLAAMLSGFVIPKAAPDSFAAWAETCLAAASAVQPVLEDETCMLAHRLDRLADAMRPYRDRIPMARIGGNDILAALHLRRAPGAMSWDTPLATAMHTVHAVLTPEGYALSAPVCDLLESPGLLVRETRRDADSGFLGKTVIHPSQIPPVIQGMRVTPQDLAQARAVLAPGSNAVFRMGGRMCESSVHRRWAERILLRADMFGTTERKTQGNTEAEAAETKPGFNGRKENGNITAERRSGLA